MKNYLKKVIGVVMVCALCIGVMPQTVNAKIDRRRTMVITEDVFPLFLDSSDGSTTIRSASITVSYAQQSGAVYVSSDETWHAVATAGWIRITKLGSIVKYELTQNNGTTMRTGTVIIYGEGYRGEFVINQEPKENQKPKENPTISIAPWEDGGTIELYL
ncbi:BACON domain-containing protein [[Clostridium] polysaccharolyticum]|uniref:Putative binding domain-containing protein, N-terminal n=1 Tax=[Clostridium] polysaccharolyticum TaxID=29364 RepID=A0A1H9Z939_9FIRM|nr:BACON domain-containing protein [[Clostridium] polysaccharolyticum]SES77383.1 Putative binding domain-containing protein, N-terminal [[Clostridium] polysaccharolyticum]